MRRLVKNFRKYGLTELTDFSNIDNFTLSAGDPADGAAIAIDNTVKHDGNPSLKITLDDDSTTNIDFTVDLYPSDVKSGIGIRWFMPAGLVMTSFNLYIGTDPGFGAGTWTQAVGVAGNEGLLADTTGGWNYRVLNSSDFTAGTPTILSDETNNLIICRISRTTVSVSESFYVNRLVSGAHVEKKGIISFDDGHETNITMAYPYMLARGIPGTCYINGALIGEANRLTEANLNTLQDAGWCIANHFYTHTNITTLSAQEAVDLADQNTAWMLGRGFVDGAYHLAYPNGAFTRGVHDVALRNAGYKSARVISATLTNQHGIGPSEMYGLYAKGVNDTITAQNVIDKFDVVSTFGGITGTTGDMAMTYIHALTDGDPVEDSQFWLESKFQTVIDDCQKKQNKGLMDFITIKDWFDGLEVSRISADRISV